MIKDIYENWIELCNETNKQERYVYCSICLKKIIYYEVYRYIHLMNKTHIICSVSCYEKFFIGF